MSWRAQSTFVASSKLAEEEKNFLKLSKKIREIWKLEERQKGGETLEGLQLEKVQGLPENIKEMITMVGKLPKGSEVLEKNQDMASLVPGSALKEAEKRRQQEEDRKQRKQEQDRRERETVRFQERHERPVTDVAASADGRYIFSSSKDKTVLCWSLAEKVLQVVRTYGGHEGAVWAVDVSCSDPPRLATSGADECIKLWPADVRGDKKGVVTPPDSTIKAGGIIKILRWCPFDAMKFATAADKLGSTPPNITIWEAAGPGKGAKQLCQIKEMPSKANALQWGAGGKVKVFSAHDNGFIGVWNAEDASLLKTIKLHQKPVTALCLSQDGKVLVSASRDMTSKAVDISTPDTPVLRTYETDRPLNAVAVSAEYSAGAEGGAVVVGGGREDRDITTSKLQEGEMDAQCFSAEGEWWSSSKGHIGPIHVIRFVPDSGYITGSEDGTIFVHDLYGKLMHTDNMRDLSR